jgi:hypothetical protein
MREKAMYRWYCSLFVLLFSLTLGCKSTNPAQERLPSELFTTSYTGYDADNYGRSCIAEDTKSCPDPTPAQEEFARKCRSRVDPSTQEKSKVYRCNCDLALCSDGEKTP